MSTAHAAHLWSRWLGPSGRRPPPLDRFLARSLKGRRDGREVSALLFATAAWAVTAWCALREEAPERLPADADDLLDVLRSADPGGLVALAGALGGVGRAPRPLWRRAEPVLGQLQARRDPVGRLVAHGIPPGWAPWLAPRLERWGERSDRWLAAQGRRPPLWGRPGRAEPAERVAEALRAEGLAVEIVGEALRIEGRRPIRATEAYRSGQVEIQDLASQAIAPLLGVEPGMRVWDACAGRGGKTVQLAQALEGRGVLWATDVDDRALEALRPRLRRTGWADQVRVLRWDGRRLPRWGREGRGGPERVLVDAPCGASGTWRRNPDARLRPPPGDPTAWAETQRSLLRLALDAVVPGGLVVYATCSVLPAEDEEVVGAVVGDGVERLDEGLQGCPEADADTLFGAVLRRG